MTRSLSRVQEWVRGQHQYFGKSTVVNGLDPGRHFDFEIPSTEAELQESRLKQNFEGDTAPWSRYLERVKKAKQELGVSPTEEACPGDDILITPLGTGSSHPSLYRNGTFITRLISIMVSLNMINSQQHFATSSRLRQYSLGCRRRELGSNFETLWPN